MTTLMLSRSHLTGGIHQAAALIRVIARALTFASLVFSVLFAFLYLAAPSILRSFARSAALHLGAITIWAAIFLGLMAMYLAWIWLSALGNWLNRLCERSPKLEAASLTLLGAVFLGFIAYGALFGKAAKSSPVPTLVVRHTHPPRDRVLLHFWTHQVPAKAHPNYPQPWMTTNIIGAAKIERLGPGHYQVWVHKEGGE
ncbi:hypothetical protein HF668_12160 [Acidithiobacillus ferridurans]|uniref:hypothetical protein n=1 Tax=Acidithiobacillus ferridurans TaxID=1232575 RepID=UPI001C073466|nr:hypothetical protein [Acidithiobacillus ferridurans]MBU2805883.1 hypothetical protein [Acidithiobacillus ferridurans]